MPAPSLYSATSWALRTTWAASPGLAVGFVAFAVLRSLTAPGIALVARGLINAAVQVARQDSHGLSTFAPWLAAALGLGTLEALVPVAGRFFRERLADDLGFAISSRVLGHAAVLDSAVLEDPEHREIIDRAQHDAAATLPRFITELEFGVTSAAQTVFLAAVLTYIEPLALLVLVPLAVPYVLAECRRADARRSGNSAHNTTRRWSRYFASALLGPGGHAEIRLLGIAPLFLDRSRTLLAQLRDAHRTILRDSFMRGSIFALLTTIGFYAVFVRVVLRVSTGSASVGDIAVFAATSPRLRAALDRAIRALQNVLRQGLAVEQLMAFFQLKPRIESVAGPVPSPDLGDLRIEDVWFTYPSARSPALAGISFTLRRGEIVALVGPNGAGKTTLIKLIARLYDPDRGQIVLAGTDLRQWPLDAVQRRIAIVSQEALRFEATVADNVAYGDWPRAAGDGPSVRAAAAAAGAAGMIDRLPRGYDTVLGQAFGEHDFSGGQWQRIALARAFVRDCPILLLDEPTAQLDGAAIQGFTRRLRDLAQGRTTLLISHRLETLLLADRILLIERGRITRSVTRAELLAHADSGPPLFTEEA